MIYIPWHIGDWVAETRLLTATERGVYCDLIVQYCSAERPITKAECKRIARAYAPEEQEAMHYVLQTFFTEEGDSYRSEKCDAEIEKVGRVSDKRKKAAEARWGKKSASEKQNECKQDANALQVESNCNANQNQNQNQNQIKKERERKPAARAARCPFEAGATIPADYSEIAAKAGIEDPARVFSAFVDHALATGRKLVDWKAGFRVWCSRELTYHPTAAAREEAQRRQQQSNIERAMARIAEEQRQAALDDGKEF